MKQYTGNKRFCQSCGMPMEQAEQFGTNEDGSKNQDYCCYCCQNGAFTAPDFTMEDMIQFNLKFNEENGHPLGTGEQARQMMEQWFPTLKRWKKQQP